MFVGIFPEIVKKCRIELLVVSNKSPLIISKFPRGRHQALIMAPRARHHNWRKLSEILKNSIIELFHNLW